MFDQIMFIKSKKAVGKIQYKYKLINILQISKDADLCPQI